MNEDVYLAFLDKDGNAIEVRQFKAVSALDLSLSSQVTEEVVESGAVIADHILHAQPSFEMRLRLFDDHSPGKYGFRTRYEAYEWLYMTWWNKKTFTMYCDFGQFDGMVIASLEPTVENTSANTFDVKISFRQIMTVEYLPANFQYVTDKDGKVYEVSPITKDGEQVTLYRPHKKNEENKSAWDNFVEWVQNNRPGWIWPK